MGDCQCIYVLTDSPDIEALAQSYNCKIYPLDESLVQPNIPSFKAIKAAYEYLVRVDKVPEHILILRATTPFRSPADISAAIDVYLKAFERGEADSLTSVTKKVAAHPARLKTITRDGYLRDHLPKEYLGDLAEENYPLPRQWFPDVYVRNGAIYIAHGSLIQQGKLWGPRQLAYAMPEERSLNINTEFEFKIAELLTQTPIELSKDALHTPDL